jgi:hypothetical protein
VVPRDKQGLEAYVARVSAPRKFSIFWDFEQGSAFRLAGIPIEAKFYLGNAVIARGLFGYTGGSGLGAPVQICMSQRDKTRIDMDLRSALFPTAPQRINHVTTNGSNHHDHIHRH